MQDSDYYSMMRKQYHNDSWEAKLKMKQQAKTAAVQTEIVAEPAVPVAGGERPAGEERPAAEERPVPDALETPATEV